MTEFDHPITGIWKLARQIQKMEASMERAERILKQLKARPARIEPPAFDIKVS